MYIFVEFSFMSYIMKCHRVASGSMPKISSFIGIFVLIQIFFGISSARAQEGLKLWYDKPAGEWVEALPVGNGRIGAMVFGGVSSELIRLNESSLWSGCPVQDSLNIDAPCYLPLIRKALFEGDFSTAAQGCRFMQGPYSASYLPLGDLHISYMMPRSAPTDYYRALNLSEASAVTRFTVAGITYEREVFASSSDDVLVVRLTASRKNSLSLYITLSSPLHYELEAPAFDELTMRGVAPIRVDPDYYVVDGRSPIVYEENGHTGMRFRTCLKVVAKGGVVSSDTCGIHVDQASEVVVLLSAATSFNGFDKYPDTEGADEKSLAENMLHKASAYTYKNLKKRHVSDFRKYFDRFSVSLGLTADSLKKIPTDRRLIAYARGYSDPELEVLYFQYGRYLLISSSRIGGRPANLQGIWNPYIQAPWSSNYTINVNTEMNYWPAEVTSLPEMHEPLLDWISGLSRTGMVTARQFYGCRGWVAHQNSDIWCMSNPVGNGVGDQTWANWYMGGNWLCRHLYEHYAYTRDKSFLQEAYPIMKGAARFCLDWLVEKDGYLLTAPSTSPENNYRVDGKIGSVTMGATMDMSIIWDLFTHLIEASAVLGIDASFRDTLVTAREQLYPLRIGSRGELLEWYDEYEEVDPHHRHVSQLYGLYPGRQISPLYTPRYAEACRRTLEMRGDGGTGWSKAWKINFWARLLDGDHAYKMIRDIMKAVGPGTSNKGGGTYPNLFDAHPPFQIDGNFGATAGLAEMLLQSHLGEIHLLPALPAVWSRGEISGLKARGGFDVSFSWRDGRLVKGEILSVAGESCTVRSKQPLFIKGAKVSAREENGYFIYTFATREGVRYKFLTE